MRLYLTMLLGALSAVAGQERELLVNGGLDDGLAGWSATPGVVLEVVQVPDRGGALRVSGRRIGLDAAWQDVRAALTAAGSGHRWAARADLLPARPAAARVTLRWTDADGDHELILAEQVIRQVDAWTSVSGSPTIAWTGTLQMARVSLEPVCVPERLAPDFLADSVSLQPDDDGDGLSTAEETAAGTSPERADSDADGLPDGWERAAGLDPSAADPVDPDGDGFTNRQEYGAATSPRDAESYPGRPADPDLIPAARAVLRYLALRPSDDQGRLVIGQHVTDLAREYPEQVAGLAAAHGRWPALLCSQIEAMNAPLQVPAATALVRDYWRAGGLVLLKWAMWNPYTGRGMNDRARPGQPDPVELQGLIDPAKAKDPEAARRARERLDGWLDAAAVGLDALQQEGIPVLFRPCSEMNGGWFWWGRRPQADYVAWWRFLFDELTVQRGLHNLIWVYESDASSHLQVPVDYYYPGDDVVDVYGHNLYHDTWVPPFESNAISRRYPKVFAIPQAGPGRQRDGSWSNLTYLDAVRERLPRLSFFAAWNSFVGPIKQGQQVEVVAAGRGRHHLAILHNAGAAELLADPWAVTRDKLPDFRAP